MRPPLLETQISAYFSLFQHIPAYSILFQHIPAYFRLFLPNPAYCILLRLFQCIQVIQSWFLFSELSIKEVAKTLKVLSFKKLPNRP